MDEVRKGKVGPKKLSLRNSRNSGIATAYSNGVFYYFSTNCNNERQNKKEHEETHIFLFGK
jgi:hypothetical protein